MLSFYQQQQWQFARPLPCASLPRCFTIALWGGQGEHYCHYYYVHFNDREAEDDRGGRTHSQSLLEVGSLSSGPASSPNLPLPIPRPHPPGWHRYQGKWTTWKACRPLTTTTLQPAGRAQTGAGSGSSPRPPHSSSAPGSRPWQVPGRGLGWGKRGRELLGCCLYASMSVPRWPGGWEDSYRHLELESLDQHCPVKLPMMMGKCSLSGVSNILSTSTCSYEHLKCGQCLLMNWICNFI